MDLRFIKSPFPDNHDGFDYSPLSESDTIREQDIESSRSKDSKLLSVLASIFN